MLLVMVYGDDDHYCINKNADEVDLICFVSNMWRWSLDSFSHINVMNGYAWIYPTITSESVYTAVSKNCLVEECQDVDNLTITLTIIMTLHRHQVKANDSQ